MPRVLRASENTYQFRCPGCGDIHSVRAYPPGHEYYAHGWEFNFDLERPTFSPSVLVTSGHFIDGWQAGSSCWCSFKAEHPDCKFNCYRCHSYIRQGQIEFLGDCSHPLVNQTVDLVEISSQEPIS